MSADEIDITTYDPKVAMANPFPMYKALREQDPVHWVEASQVWVVSSYDRILEVATDDDTYQQAYVHREVSRNGPQVRDQTYFQLFRRMLFLLDGEEHRQVRPLFARWFMGPARARMLQPIVERVADAVLGELDGVGSFDVVKDFGYAIPLRVISELLGVPASDSASIAHDLEAIVPMIESVPKTPEVRARAEAAIGRVKQYFIDLIAERRRTMGDDLLSSMITVADEGAFVDDDALVANLLLAYLGGHETTTDSLTLSVLSLCRHPDQMARLRDNPGMMAIAVDELLRYDSTAQGFSRSPQKDVELGGKAIKAGSFIVNLLGAGNRDPKIFENPDTLDLHRAPRNTLSFGGGAHVCVANMLARAEMRTGLAKLLERKPNLELETTDPPLADYKATLTRGLLTLKARG